MKGFQENVKKTGKKKKKKLPTLGFELTLFSRGEKV